MLKAGARPPFDSSNVYTDVVTQTVEFPLNKGNHLIQFSVESRISPKIIKDYWDT